MFFNTDNTLGDLFDFGFGFDGTPNTNTTTTTESRDPHWLDIFNTASGLASQIIAAIGKRPTTQIGVGGVTALPNSLGQTGYYGTGQYPTTQQNPYGASQNVGQSVGSSLGSGLDGVFNWAVQNPLLVGGFALGVFLLFRDPPRRR